MATTYQAIATVEVGASGVTEILFSSIPQTYTDLKLVWSTRLNSGSVATRFTLNNNSNTIYNQIRFYGNGTTVGSDKTTLSTHWDFKGSVNTSYTSNTFSNSELYIPNYTSTSQYKSASADWSGENNATAAELGFSCGVFESTDAITSIKIWRGSDTILQYSTATLYGIKNS